jgi:hypothetical protein
MAFHREYTSHFTVTVARVVAFHIVRKAININEFEILSNFTLTCRYKSIKLND